MTNERFDQESKRYMEQELARIPLPYDVEVDGAIFRAGSPALRAIQQAQQSCEHNRKRTVSAERALEHHIAAYRKDGGPF